MSQKLSAVVPQLALAGLVLAAGFATAAALVKSAPKVAKASPDSRLQTVTFRKAVVTDHPITITAHGVLRASQEVVMRPQASGAVTWISPDLVPGHRVAAGTELVRIDPQDYKLALTRAQATLRQAQQTLELELGRSRIAKKEWGLFKGGGSLAAASKQSQSLALRKPQLVTAQTTVVSAQADVDRAKLALARTTLKAPFDALVQRKLVDVGKVVGPQNDLVHLVGTDSAWIELPLAPQLLSRLDLAAAEGEVSSSFAGERITRKAKVLHLLPDLDPQIRLTRVLVEVERPFDSDLEGGTRPLLLGTYCRVELSGRPLQGVVGLPRGAVHERNRVFFLDTEDKLTVRELTPIWDEPNTLWFSENIAAGDRVITSHVAAPVVGTKLAPQQDSTEAER